MAAASPNAPPIKKASIVVAKATPTVFHAPNINLENISRPIWSVPNI